MISNNKFKQHNQNKSSFNQSGVIPYRYKNNELQILIITTRKGKHWTIPKGNIERNLTPAQSAEKEAFEEAGITGNLDPIPVGIYTYQKSGKLYHVQVFLLEVKQESTDWPECGFRNRQWLNMKEVLNYINNEQLNHLLLKSESQIKKIHQQI